MSLGLSLDDLFKLSKLEEGDSPVYASKTGAYNFGGINVNVNGLGVNVVGGPGLSARSLIYGAEGTYNDKGVMYSHDGKTLMLCPQNRPGRVRIHEGVEQIAPDAFHGGALTEIIMPDSLIAIGSDAFANSAVQNITFGNGIQQIGGNYRQPRDKDDENEEPSEENEDEYDEDEEENDESWDMYSGLFNNCTGLSSVVIPDNVKVVSGNVFLNCFNLRNVVLSKNLQSIGGLAFYNCPLENAVIPKSVTNLGESSLYDSVSIVLEKVHNGLIKAVSEASYENDYGRYEEPDALQTPNYVEISYKGHKIFIPHRIRGKELDVLDKKFNESWFTSQDGHRLFTYGATPVIKQDTAYAEYRCNKSSDAFSFMKKCGKEMAERYLSEKNQEKFVEFLKTGAVERKYLPDLLKQANQQEKAAAAAYIMHALGQTCCNDDEDPRFNL